MLAKKYEPKKHNIDGWLMSEKLDGMRAVWDGKELRTRTGKPIYAPEWFTSQIPKVHWFDGELFLGRGKFQELISITRSHKKDKEWEKVQYVVFDLPRNESGFETRLMSARTLLDGATHSYVLNHFVCKDFDAALKFYQKVRGFGGEGIMFRRAGSAYAWKRSRDLLKWKGMIEGTAVFLHIQAGEGKYKGMMGALVVKCLKTGVVFKIGTGFTDAERELSYWVTGSTIPWTAHELTKDGVPRHSRYDRPNSE